MTVTDAGVAAFDTSLALAIFAKSVLENPTRRQVVETGTGTILGAGGTSVATFESDAGGTIFRSLRPPIGGADLGQNYRQLNPTFQKLGKSAYFQHPSSNLLRRSL